MGRLTAEEWKAQKPPFVWMKVKGLGDQVHLDIVDKWINSQISGWWYVSSTSPSERYFVFEHKADMVTFKLWLTTNPFDEEAGEVK